ncbi:nuclear transport factor 2 family protein [Spirosoma sp. HMF4905]|uniref:Nuclear transport factor 2 family protein n=1 Tax=Spirosoma arboris TaxID=2682092 RepID=A0A7K1SHM1_9BACT|nr:nuclear transport factor 2 family protein [Spirosoma arboris]MVM33301.1 nuclear transport factor 2 family protein [Spirosoma arboris]
MNQEQAYQFADEWISAFNAHDLTAILDHYADELKFYSPFIPQLKFNESGCITSKRDLERYFQLSLATYLNLHFTLHNVFVGIDTLAIYYTSVNDRLACEVFQLNEQGKAAIIYCHYAMTKSIPEKA